MTLLETLKTDSQKRFLLFASSVAFLALGASQAMYGPFYGVFRSEFGLSASKVALTTMFHFAGGTGALLISAVVVRRLGSIPVAAACSALLTAGLIAVALAPSFAFVLAGASLVGIGFGGLQVLNFLIARIFVAHRAAALNLLNAVFSVGAILAPLAAAPFVTADSYRPLFAMLSVVGVVVFILLLLQPRAIGTDPATPRKLPRTWPVAFAVLGFLLLYFFYVGSETSFTSWIPTHLATAYADGLSARMAGLFWAALTLGRLVAIPVSGRMKSPILVILALSGAFLATVVSRSAGAAPAAYVVVGFFLGPVFPAGLAWIADRFPYNSSSISAFVLAGGGFGAILFPPTIGSLVDAFSPAVIPVSIAAVLLAGVVTAVTIRLTARRQRVA
ncbi:MAG: MFS transporter [Spirochaetota bacterium]